MVGVYTVCAYGGIGIIACGYWYLTSRKPRRQQPNRANQQRELKERERTRASQREKENKSKKLKGNGESSGNEAQRRNKTKKEVQDTETSFLPLQDNTPDNDVDDREFARQLSNVKSGTSMAPKKDTASRQKSVKLSKAMTSDDDSIAARKTNGEHGSDGDDDLSFAESPELNPTTVKAGDVSDMLESTTGGPSILRLTESTAPQPSKPKKTVKQKEPELTKKQRQNQAKREAAKSLRQEDEQARRALEEKQRRTAREAEGRAAKDGSSTIYQAPPPKSSAWTSQNTPTNQQNVQLLDTYDAESPAGDSSPGAKQESVDKQHQKAPASHYSDLPSEEEQIRLLNENEGWNEVKSKKSKGKLPNSSEVPGAALSNITNGTNGKFDRLGDFEVEA